MLNRAYSLLEIKRIDEDARVIAGMASTPTVDRMDDIVEPEGAQFKLPLPLLWHHDSREPIGHVTSAKSGKDGIEIAAKLARIAEPGKLKDRLDEAWQSIKAGLVRGLSIGFRAIEHSVLESGGLRFLSWELLELSVVTVPANAEATITTIKSIDIAQRAAPGRKARAVVHLNPPGASGHQRAQEGTMKTIAEQITALEAKRVASATRMEAIMQKTLDEDRTTTAEEQDDFDARQGEVDAIDKDLVRLRAVEKAKAFAAKPIKAETPQQGADARAGIIIRTQPTLPPGIEAARIWKCRMNSVLSMTRGDFCSASDIALRMYGPDSNVVASFTKANVPAGATVAGNWAANLVGSETGALADFVAYLRPMTILGRFGTGGIPSLRSVPFRTPLVTETGGGAGYWVGEGKAKPLTSFSFTRTTLAPLKVANICALTDEVIRDSSPKADAIVRDALAAALRERLDVDFITPSKAAVAGVSPASITNGAASIVSSGDDADAIRVDIRSLFAKFSAANNPVTSGVWIMPSAQAIALSMMTNPLGQTEFSTMTPTGGTLYGMPVIASDYVPAGIVVLVNASDIYEADDGEVAVDMSREASLEMSDAPTHNSITPTGATSMVSMFQTNTVAIRAERTINWMRRRTQSVAYLTSADWGGPVHTA